MLGVIAKSFSIGVIFPLKLSASTSNLLKT